METETRPLNEELKGGLPGPKTLNNNKFNFQKKNQKGETALGII